LPAADPATVKKAEVEESVLRAASSEGEGRRRKENWNVAPTVESKLEVELAAGAAGEMTALPWFPGSH
jgi:hypothetical protein